MKTTFYAGRDLQVQQQKFAVGDIIGEGDLDQKQFVPAGKAKGCVELGHVLPRVADGRIVTTAPKAEAEAKTKGKAKTDPKAKAEASE